MILHLIAKSEWDALPAQTPYLPATFGADGFIHCTGDELLMLSVANRFYTGVQGDVIVLQIDESKLTSQLKWEAPAHIEPVPPEVDAEFGAGLAATVTFPHIYGPLNRDAIVGIKTLKRDAAGRYTGYVVTQATAPAAPVAPVAKPATPENTNNPLNTKSHSQMAQELLDATDNFSDAMSRYKDQVQARIDELNKKIDGL